MLVPSLTFDSGNCRLLGGNMVSVWSYLWAQPTCLMAPFYWICLLKASLQLEATLSTASIKHPHGTSDCQQSSCIMGDVGAKFWQGRRIGGTRNPVSPWVMFLNFNSHPWRLPSYSHFQLLLEGFRSDALSCSHKRWWEELKEEEVGNPSCFLTSLHPTGHGVKWVRTLDCLFWKVTEIVAHNPTPTTTEKVWKEEVSDTVWPSTKNRCWSTHLFSCLTVFTSCLLAFWGRIVSLFSACLLKTAWLLLLEASSVSLVV